MTAADEADAGAASDVAGAATAIVDAALAIQRRAADADPSILAARLTAILWATVALDRAEAELGRALGTELRTRPAARDSRLGATVRTSRPFGPTPQPALWLVEPDTEGRLAALLARHGEGVVGVEIELAGRMRRVELTSDGGGRSPRGASVRPGGAAS